MERYIPIARRYRPRTFSEIVGQDQIVRILQNQLATGRVPHAFLFSGTRGVGKTSTARILAKALNCEKGVTPEPCNQCAACKAIDQGNFMGLMEIDGASNRGIDEVRNLQEVISQRALEGRFRVVIIDEVHMLTQEAFNALLKTLEEPPPHVVFVLATTDYQRLPITIISRTVHFHFREIPEELIKEKILDIAQKEGFEIDEDAAQIIAQGAEGSLRDAQTALEKVIAFSQGKITREEAERALGLVPRSIMEDLTRAISSGKRAEIFSIVKEIIIQGYNLRRFVRDYMAFLRGVLLEKARGNSRVFPELSREDLLRYLQILIDGEYRLRNASNPRTYLELMFLKMSFLRHIVDFEELVDRMVKGEVAHPTGPVKGARQAPPRRERTLKDLEAALSRRSEVLATAFREADSAELREDTLSLIYSREFYYKRLLRKQEVVEEVASRVFGRKIKVEAVFKEEESGNAPRKEGESEDSKVLLLKRVFKAREIKEE